ncbi:MAG: glycosyltransferase family 87 protein [Sphingomicrobium sp.]
MRDLWLTHGLVIDRLDVWGRDFVNVWTGGQLIREGSLSTLADVAAYQAFQQRLFGPLGQHNYSYPPVTYPVAALLSHLPYLLALAVWQVAGAAFFVWAAKPWWPRGAGPVWLVVVTPAALLNIWAGHYGFFIGGLFLLGWRQVELGRSTLAGLCFGLMIIKPHIAVLIPLALASRREWRAIASAAITALALVTVTAAIYGIQPWYDFLFGTSRVQASLIDPHGSFFGLMSTSSATAVLSLSGSWTLALLVQLLFAGAALWIVVASGLRSTDVRSHALLTATATFLFLPYAFNYDMTVVAIGAITVMISANASTTERRLAFYGFVGPQFGMILAAFGLPLVPVFNAGLLAAQFRRARRGCQAPALSARTVRSWSLTSAKPPVTGMRLGWAPWLR